MNFLVFQKTQEGVSILNKGLTITRTMHSAYTMDVSFAFHGNY